jgi:hypothetical protein
MPFHMKFGFFEMADSSFYLVQFAFQFVPIFFEVVSKIHPYL